MSDGRSEIFYAKFDPDSGQCRRVCFCAAASGIPVFSIKWADENLDRFRTPRGYQYYRRQFSAQILTFSFEILSALSQVFLGLDDFSFSLSYLALVLADFLFACPATNVFAQFCAIRFQLLPGIL